LFFLPRFVPTVDSAKGAFTQYNIVCGSGIIAVPMPILYQTIKHIAGIARYPLSQPIVVGLQEWMLRADPDFRRRWGARGRRVSSRISPRDAMYLGELGQYYAVGLSALDCIESAQQAAGTARPRSVLDLPCGHGRVLRFLVERFPEARFSACDLDQNGVSFCAQTFGATAVVSRADIETLTLDERFDLIWCGSLLTHLDESRIELLLRWFQRHLEPGGLLVFSTHGRLAADMLRRGKVFSYGLEKTAAQHVLQSHARTGFGYSDYDARKPGYGVTMASPVWIRATLAKLGGLREVYFGESAWADHHDVYGVVQTG
jgi:SAM-dependent methyltransferase